MTGPSRRGPEYDWPLIGDRLQAWRVAEGLDQVMVAARFKTTFGGNWSPAKVSKIVKGHGLPSPDYETLLALRSVLGPLPLVGGGTEATDSDAEVQAILATITPHIRGVLSDATPGRRVQIIEHFQNQVRLLAGLVNDAQVPTVDPQVPAGDPRPSDDPETPEPRPTEPIEQTGRRRLRPDDKPRPRAS